MVPVIRAELFTAVLSNVNAPPGMKNPFASRRRAVSTIDPSGATLALAVLPSGEVAAGGTFLGLTPVPTGVVLYANGTLTPVTTGDGGVNDAIRLLSTLLAQAGDEDEPLYLHYKSNSDTPEPLWGQYGAAFRVAEYVKPHFEINVVPDKAALKIGFGELLKIWATVVEQFS